MKTNLSKSSRVPEIEILKFTVIVTMILVHVVEISIGGNLKFESVVDYVATFFVFLIRIAPGAGAFIFAMGWGAFFSRGSADKYLKRIPQLILLGILVNFFECLVRSFLAPEIFGTLEDIRIGLFAGDIYFFAALASIYLALMKFFQDKPRIATAISLILLVVCVAIRIYFGFDQDYSKTMWGDIILGLFLRESEWSCFPFTSWIIYVILGYFVAKFYTEIDDKNKFFRFSLVSGILAVAVAGLLMKIFEIPNVYANPIEITESELYAMHPVYALFDCGLIGIEIYIFNLIMNRVKNLPDFISSVSKNVMVIYVLQWMVIGTLAPQIYFVENIFVVILISSVILICVCKFAEIFNRFKKNFI